MRGLIKILCCILVIGSVQKILGGNSASHTISIRVVRPNSFTIDHNETDPLMPNTSHTGNQSVLSESSGRHLKWNTDHHDKKITVAAHTPSSEAKIQVKVVQCEGGDIKKMIPIVNCDHDFISSMSHSQGSCDLMYSVIHPDGISSNQELHEVVYTITDVF